MNFFFSINISINKLSPITMSNYKILTHLVNPHEKAISRPHKFIPGISSPRARANNELIRSPARGPLLI